MAPVDSQSRNSQLGMRILDQARTSLGSQMKLQTSGKEQPVLLHKRIATKPAIETKKPPKAPSIATQSLYQLVKAKNSNYLGGGLQHKPLPVPVPSPSRCAS